MQGPQDGPVHPAQGLKEQWQVQIASVQVVQMDDVRGESLHLPHEAHRAKYAAVALRVRELSHGAVQLALPGPSYAAGIGPGFGRNAGHAVADLTRPAVRLHQPGNFQGNAPRAFDTAIGVKLKDPHLIPLPQAT